MSAGTWGSGSRVTGRGRPRQTDSRKQGRGTGSRRSLEPGREGWAESRADCRPGQARSSGLGARAAQLPSILALAL